MALRLQVVSRHKQGLRERSTKEFGQDGGTIGRSLESHWVLPDAQRFVSSRHASIDFRSGSYYIIDTSSNGVYINGSNTPVGRGNPQRLFPGDRIRMGEYEMLVEIDESNSTQEHIPNQPHIDPVDRMQRVDAADPTTNSNLVDPFEITGVGIESLLDQDQASTLSPLDYGFESSELTLVPEQGEQESSAPKPIPLTVTPSAPAAAKPGTSATARARANPPQPGPVKVKRKRKISARATAAVAAAVRPAPVASAPVASEPAPTLTLDAFFRGAGMPAMALDEQQSEALLLRLGQLVRETITGLTENLHLRAAQRSLLRQSNTTIQPRDNNSLKFSAGVDEALNNLLFRDSEQYLDAVEAIREGFGDIRRHQQILMKAMLDAVVAYIDRADPEQLEQKFSNGRTGIMGAANKLKYWDLFKDLYQVLAQRNPGEFPAAFLEEIARTYDVEATRVMGTRPDKKVKASVA